jgi:biopolymer transport protein ExbD
LFFFWEGGIKMKFKRRLKPTAEVNLVPMIDVVFQLVIFFMLSSTFIINPGISVVLPGSATAEPVAMTKIVITIASRQDIYLNNQHYNLEGLSDALARLTGDDKDRINTVIIEGDKSVSYELMIQVLDIVRANGFKGVNLRTREID